MSNIAIVTGASSGFGKEFVTQLATKYPKLDEIWVIARRREKLLELVQEVKNVYVRIVTMDITKTRNINRLKELLNKYTPTVRVLVNNAGYGINGAFEREDIEEQLGMIYLNCVALTRITYLALPYMKAKSQIIQIASAAAFLPQPSFAVYSATKAYVYSFSRAISRELTNRRITVTTVCPGPAKTDFFDIACKNKEMKEYKKYFMSEPHLVVKKAIKDAKKGKVLSVYGVAMKAVRLASRVIPNRWILRFMK